MIEKNSIQFYWNRAINALKSAKALHSLELYDDSISRSYYAILNAARAGLLVHHVVSKSHSGLQRMFGHYLIQSGEIEKGFYLRISG